MMAGEVGGLYDLFVLILATVFGFVSNRFLMVDLVQKLFEGEVNDA